MLTKVCTKCGIEQEIVSFYKQKEGRYGVRSVCRDCCINYYQTNKKVILTQQLQYYAANKKTIAVRKRQYQQNNSYKINAISAKRKARKIKATPTWADQDNINDMYRLAVIFNSTGMNLHVDHIVPLQSDIVCGLHCEANLQLLPAGNNTSKGNRWWPDMW